MNARLATASCSAALVVALGCTDDRSTVSRGPLEAAPLLGVTGATACEPLLAENLAFVYFPLALVPEAKQRIRDMVAAGPGTAAARAAGFDVMALIEDVVQAGTGGLPTYGSSLTNELIECMFAPADFPAVFPAAFTAAIDPAQDGAYAVRGPSGDADPVLARGAFAFSGVAPQPGMTWGDALDERVLIVGERIGPEAYDWSMVRPGASFDPPVVVGVCVESGGTSMLLEENVGILAFVDPTYFLPCPNLIAAGTAPSPARPLARLVRLAARLVGPSPLHAATLMPGGTGGLAGGLRSVFEPIDLVTVGNVGLAFTVQPVDAKERQTLPLVQVRATTGQGTPVAGVRISLRAVINNGYPVTLSGTTSQITGLDGLASFADLSLNKPGAYHLLASGTVVGRSAIPVAGARSARFHIRPRK